MRIRAGAATWWVALAAAAWTWPAASGAEQATTMTVAFHPSLVNLEYSADRMKPAPPEGVDRVPPAEGGTIWFGVVIRGEGGDAAPSRTHAPVFAARYDGARATGAWFDANRNGDLTDDPPVTLYAYAPGGMDCRSMIVDVRWDGGEDSAAPGAEPRKIRIVLDPPEGDGVAPQYRSQFVFAMEGEVALEGRTHRAVLYDGNLDGVYSRKFADGIFIDLNDDGRIDVDAMSPEFAPLTVPFQMGARRYEVTRVDPRGATVEIRDLGASPPVPTARVGEIAPDFAMVDLDGRLVRLSAFRGRVVIVYFFASWCATCAYQAEPLVELYRAYRSRGLEILGVSYDTERDSLDAYRVRHGETWPASFTGTAFWENPVGRLYRAGGAGLAYLVTRDGVLEGKYTDVPQLTERVGRLVGGPVRTAVQSRWQAPPGAGSP